MMGVYVAEPVNENDVKNEVDIVSSPPVEGADFKSLHRRAVPPCLT